VLLVLPRRHRCGSRGGLRAFARRGRQRRLRQRWWRWQQRRL